jgi:MYXO-CTERM domain-containing protein
MRRGLTFALRAGMTRTSSVSWIAAVLLTLAFMDGTPVAAQTAGSGATTPAGNPGINVILKRVGNDAYTDLSKMTPIGKSQCDQGTFTVDLTGLPASLVSGGYMFLEVWAQTGNNDCTSATRDIDLNAENKCTKLNKTQIRLNGQTMISGLVVPLTAADGDSTQGVCAAEGPRTIYFLALRGTASNEATSVYGTLIVQIATTPPGAPTNVVGGSGETEIPVTWTNPPQQIYSVYTLIDPLAEEDATGVDDDGGVSAGCISRTLMEDASIDPSNPPKGVRVLGPIEKMAKETTINGDDLNTELAAVGIIVGDRAKNFSHLSNIGCIKVTPTAGFWDTYEKEGGGAGNGCSCSAVGARGDGNAWFALPVLGVLAWLGVRRRNRGQA